MKECHQLTLDTTKFSKTAPSGAVTIQQQILSPNASPITVAIRCIFSPTPMGASSKLPRWLAG